MRANKLSLLPITFSLTAALAGCAGADGEAGMNGLSGLLTLTAEPAGDPA